jgi:hypothetical protein
MKLRGKEIIVHRGETFTLDMNIKNRDGSPYILSKDLKNQYLLLSIASSKYSQANGYSSARWLALPDLDDKGNTAYVKFDDTVPHDMGKEFDSSKVAPDGEAYVYTAIENGVRKYKYYDSSTNTFIDYSLRVVTKFNYAETITWVPQAYDYSLTLMAGEINPDYTTGSTQPPIINYTDVIPIIEPSRLTVLPDIRNLPIKNLT